MGKKWQNGTPDDHSDDLDVEHGSVNEISSVVASTGERMAEIMPGILLILGLLGTFLGLGMALNKASSILIDANSAGMDSAMSNLMGMMEGLGTKFKTSTWGITAFLFLKIFSAANGYEEKRRCSIYVLVNIFTPPNNHDFASLCFCSHTRNHAK